MRLSLTALAARTLYPRPYRLGDLPRAELWVENDRSARLVRYGPEVEMPPEVARQLGPRGQMDFGVVTQHLGPPKIRSLKQAAWNPPGQWWERQGQVLLLHPAMDPNNDPDYQGWQRVTPEQARQYLQAQPQ